MVCLTVALACCDGGRTKDSVAMKDLVVASDVGSADWWMWMVLGWRQINLRPQKRNFETEVMTESASEEP
jgi:hypothetical protein